MESQKLKLWNKFKEIDVDLLVKLMGFLEERINNVLDTEGNLEIFYENDVIF